MPYIGDVFVEVVESDQPGYSVKVTSHPVESGGSVADHVEQQPLSLTINGRITGKDAASRLQKIKKYMEDGTMVSYRNRIAVTGILIVDFKPVHDKTDRKGFAFTITFTSVKIAKTSIEKEMILPKRAKVKAKENKGNKQKKSTKSIKGKNKSKKKDKDKVTAVSAKVGGMTPAQAAAKNGNKVYGK